ncbi:OLC1v1031454C1 [Oldenlandia corymbosa var. corymbosa]|uniref:OLC1v1031454C1 n=1 Tax=Oldenlandia corymbosa var. corymbosa TaxID=529605 RepID=A0AAV1CKG6_OLDCO|nr:OLC1v1031454C1 [Oldenlandia corymbosa var. corymbosa]
MGKATLQWPNFVCAVQSSPCPRLTVFQNKFMLQGMWPSNYTTRIEYCDRNDPHNKLGQSDATQRDLFWADVMRDLGDYFQTGVLETRMVNTRQMCPD